VGEGQGKTEQAGEAAGAVPAPPAPFVAQERSTASRVGIVLIALALAVGAYVASRGLTNEMAARTVALFVFVAAFWATEVVPLFATALLAVCLEIVLLASDGGLAQPVTRLLDVLGVPPAAEPDVAPISARVFIAAFARDVIFLLLGGLALSKALKKHRVDEVIAATLLRPCTRSAWWLICGVLAVSGFFSMWMSNTATAAMMVAIVQPLLRHLPRHSPVRHAVFLAVPFGASIGGIGTPVGTPPNAIAYGALNAAGYEVTFVRWMLGAVPLAVALLGVAALFLYRLLPASADLRELGEIRRPGVLSRQGRATLVVLAATVVLWLTGGQTGLPAGVVALIAAAGLTVTGLLDRRDVDGIDWNVLVLVWGGLSLGVAMEQSGLTASIGGLNVADAPGGAWTVALFVVFTAVFLSTFMSNTATAALLVPMALALGVPGREQFAVLAAFACSFALALPVSTPPNAIAYTTGEIPLRVMLRVGALTSLVSALVTLLGCRLVLPLVFG
jgi:sodium-dependent dicarboxylate transporter 2/3/5